MREDDSFDFKTENLPVRVCFAKHVRFMQDKAAAPELFCWPAMYFVQHNGFDVDLARSQEMWKRHEPLFIADLGGEIRPTLRSEKDERMVQQTFNEFYRWNILYDMARQWIVRNGPFEYDYTWLTPSYTRTVTKPFSDAIFSDVFGISPDSLS